MIKRETVAILTLKGINSTFRILCHVTPTPLRNYPEFRINHHIQIWIAPSLVLILTLNTQ